MNTKQDESPNKSHAAQKLAAWLTRHSEKLSPTKVKFMLMIVGTTMATMSILLITNSVNTISNDHSIRPHAIEMPQIISPDLQLEAFMTPEDYQMLLQFLQRMDSLKKSPEGLVLYNDITRGHPGLLDSINTLISMYQHLPY